VIKEKSAEEIKAYLVERYGNFIIYNPPIEPATYILWFGPFLLIILSLGSIILYRRKQA
jgi:cytochrome c-type biogenesis protein CcmH